MASLIRTGTLHSINTAPDWLGSSSALYLPLISNTGACDAVAMTQLQATAKWVGQFSFDLKANASAPTANNTQGAVVINRAAQFAPPIALTKQHNTPSLVDWRSGLAYTGRLAVNDIYTQTSSAGATALKTAKFSMTASSDAVSLAVYPDACKLRVTLWGFANGRVSGAAKTLADFEFCATIDVPSPKAGVQSFSGSVPVYLNNASVPATTTALAAGLKCRTTALPSTVSEDFFASTLGLLKDGGLTSGPISAGTAPVGDVYVTYTFTPQ